MILQAQQRRTVPHVDCDICIVGSGAAGLTIAAELAARHGRALPRVLVLEASATRNPVNPRNAGHRRGQVGRAYGELHSDVQGFYEGEAGVTLRQLQKNYLVTSRLHAFGGTTNVWSGWWLPLEPRDLHPTPVNPDGWPVSYEELMFYYTRARAHHGLGPLRHDDPYYWRRHVSHGLTPMETEAFGLRTRIVEFKAVNFRKRYWQLLDASTRVQVLLNAHCVGFECSGSSSKRQTVQTLLAQSLESGRAGPVINVRARSYVLAAGPLEATRILLLNNLGNAHDQVGRHFIEHPYAWSTGQLPLRRHLPKSLQRLYFANKPIDTDCGTRILGALVPTAELMNRERILSFRALLGGASDIPGSISLCWEQRPQSRGRITLSRSLPPDVLGRRRLKVETCISAQEIRTHQTARSSVLDALSGQGLIEPGARCGGIGKLVMGNHPAGTTRFSRSPRNGVVDGNARVHGTTNLYVSGASTFGSAGHANPTYTVVALAIRLADHLQSLHGGTA